MTEVLSRAPLHLLDMSSTQRPVRRRSARLGGEEEDARPAKRAKTDEKESGIGKHGTTRKATATGKKAKVGKSLSDWKNMRPCLMKSATNALSL